MKKWLFSIVFVLCILGCTKSVNEQGKTTYKINPLVSEQIEAPVEATGNLLTALAPVIPYAGTAGLALLSALGIYRKTVKPQFDEARDEANMYHTTTHTLIQVVEAIKKDEPELWAKIEPYMDSKIGTNTENVIRAIRGLPPKE